MEFTATKKINYIHVHFSHNWLCTGITFVSTLGNHSWLGLEDEKGSWGLNPGWSVPSICPIHCAIALTSNGLLFIIMKLKRSSRFTVNLYTQSSYRHSNPPPAQLSPINTISHQLETWVWLVCFTVAVFIEQDSTILHFDHWWPGLFFISMNLSFYILLTISSHSVSLSLPSLNWACRL